MWINCYEWFIKARNKGIPLSGPLVRSKAKEIAKTLGVQNFSLFGLVGKVSFRRTPLLNGQNITDGRCPLKGDFTVIENCIK